jgi:hypothetical protein
MKTFNAGDVEGNMEMDAQNLYRAEELFDYNGLAAFFKMSAGTLRH